MSTVRLEGNEAVLRRLIKVFGIATAYCKTSRAVRRENWLQGACIVMWMAFIPR